MEDSESSSPVTGKSVQHLLVGSSNHCNDIMNGNASGVSTKSSQPHIYVPPRIDPDLYQVEVPSMVAADRREAALHCEVLQRSLVAFEENSYKAQEFLIAARNLMESLRCQSEEHWSSQTSSLPLESDSAILEFLGAFNYDVDYAWFYLWGTLSQGKEGVSTSRLLAQTEKFSPALLFSEFREKVLRSSKRLLGCYESTPGYTVFDEHFYGDATNFTLSSGGVTNAGINSNTTLDLPFFDEVSRISQLDSTPIECKESAAAMLEAGDNIAALMIQSMMSPEEDHAGSKDDPDSSLQEAIPSSRISLRANKGEKKNEFRRRWDDIMKRGQAILDSSSTSIPPLELDASKLSGTDLFNTTSLPLPLMASARYRPGKIAVDDSFNLHLELTFYSSITLATGNINKIRSLDNSGSLERSTAAEAQQLLDDALLMSQTYQLSSASQLKQQLGNVGCSGGVTTSEDPAESFRSLMGDLLKALLITRNWSAQVRDLFHNYNINAVIEWKRFKGSMQDWYKREAVVRIKVLLDLVGKGYKLTIHPQDLSVVKKAVIDMQMLVYYVRVILAHSVCARSRCDTLHTYLSQREKDGPRCNGSRGAVLDLFDPFAKAVKYPKSFSSSVDSRQRCDYSLEEIAGFMLLGTGLSPPKPLQLASSDEYSNCFQGMNDPILAEPCQAFDMHAIEILLNFANTSPIKVNESFYVGFLLRCARDINDELQTVLQHATDLLFTKSKLLLDARKRYSIDSLIQLCTIALNFPIRIPSVEALQELINSCQDWIRQVNMISCEDGKSQPTSLKSIEQLISTGERMVVEVASEIEILKAKKNQAKLWLERLKKSFAPKAIGRAQSLRTVSSGSGALEATERIKLTDMKLMIQEGEQFFGAGQQLSDTISSESGSRVKTSYKELDRAISVVDDAEDWLTRMKNILNFDSSTFSSLTTFPTGANLNENQERILVASEEIQEETREQLENCEPTSCEEVICILKELLAEVECMPVTLDEVDVLRCHLAALEWSMRIKPTVLTMLEYTSKRAHKQTLLSTRLPKLQEIQSFVRDIKSIRDSLPDNVAKDFPLKALPEEAYITNTLTEVDAWIIRVKKLQQGNTIKKGIQLVKVLKIFEESKDIPVNLDTELRVVKAALKAVGGWLQTNRNELSFLNISTGTDVVLSELFKVLDVSNQTDESTDADMDCEVDLEEEKETKDAPHTSKMILYLSDLERIVQSGANLLIDFECLGKLKDRLASAQQWLRDAKSFLNVSRLTNDDQIIINIISGDRRRRGTETGEKVGDGINEEDSSATKSENKLERSRDGKMLPKELLIKLLDSVDDFGLCFDVEKDKLQMICAACSSWSEKAKAFLETSVCSELKRCFEAYLDLVNKDSSKLNLPFLESIQFKRQNEDVHAISAALEESLSEVNEVEIFCVIDELAMEILKLRCEGDEIGVLTQTHGEIDLILGCISWLTATRALLSHGRYFLNEKQCPGCYNSAVLLQEVQIDELSSNFNDSIMSAALHRKVLRNHAPPPMLNSFSVLERLQCLHCLRQGIDVSDACFFELCWKGCKWGDVDLRYCQAMKEEAELLFSFQQNSSKNSRNEFLQLYSSAPILPFVDSKDEFPDSLTEEGTVKNEDTSRTITKVAVGSKRRIEHSKKEQLETRNKKRKANPDEEEMRGSTSSAVDEEPADLFLHFLDNLKFRKSKLKELVKNVAVSIIPTSLFGLIDFWLRALEIMQARLIQASRWTDSARKLLSRNPKINDQASGELLQKEADQLLIEAYANGIHSHYRSDLTDCLNYSKEWQAKAQRILRREKGSLLTIDTLTEFITVHANNFCDGELLKLLREELDKATEWVTQLIESGYTQGNPSLTISYEKVNQLLREGKEELCVDVSEYLESIATATKTYCFCRQLYHGEMIGCDQCEEWYHLPCIGMTAMQAEKCEQYVCLRCMIKDLYFQTGIKMAKTTNKWMSVELQKSRDNHTAKLSRRFIKETKELQKAEQDFATFSHSLMKRYSFILSDHHSVLNGEGNSTNRGFDSENDSTRTDPLRERLISVLTAEDLSEFKALESNYHERKSSYKRAHEESNEYADQLQMENEKHKQIIEWMHEVQNLIWPDNTYHAVQGKPLGATLDLQKFNVDVTDRSSSVCETDHLFAANDIGYYSSLTPKLMNLLAASTALLPHSLLPLFTSVQHLGIIKVHDVLTIVDCYRMMGWTSISLQLLRGSPTTKALQLLIDVGQSIQSTGVDHSKIVRFLENMLTRGRTWKTKCKKILSTSKTKIDRTKVTALLLEGSTIPIASKLKDVLSHICSSEYTENLGDAIEISSCFKIYDNYDLNGSCLSVASGGKKRLKKAKSNETSRESEVEIAISSEWLQEQAPFSSDEEDNTYPKVSASRFSVSHHDKSGNTNLAPIARLPWPQKIDILRIKPTSTELIHPEYNPSVKFGY